MYTGVSVGINVVKMETCFHWICLSPGGKQVRVTWLQNATQQT